MADQPSAWEAKLGGKIDQLGATIQVHLDAIEKQLASLAETDKMQRNELRDLEKRIRVVEIAQERTATKVAIIVSIVGTGGAGAGVLLSKLMGG